MTEKLKPTSAFADVALGATTDGRRTARPEPALSDKSACGNPGLCHRCPPKGYEFSFSDGLISQVRMVDGFAQYQTACPISPGNSGGPLLNARGEVLGVVSWSKNDAQNLNFATPAACLFSLNPRSPVIPWTQLPVELRTRRKALATRADPKRTRTAAAVNSELHELRQVLRQSQRQPLTITVRNATEEHVFNVTLPPDCLK